MAITGISHKVRATLNTLASSGSDPHLQEVTAEVLELAEAVERLSMEVDGLVDGRGRFGAGPPRS
jgi:hypothetical protein